MSEIQAQLTAGRLRPVPSHRESGGGDLPDEVAFDDLKPDNGWPDFLQHRFACRGCGAEFELTCETFHGRGGNWQRVSPGR
ncbi:MAG: hypothetical protein FGM52_08195 [Mycobacterium sp.]|nr:hypothetical protein [Mycobacterium sp.]